MAKDNKTEKATPRRIKKARNEGNVAKSKELNNAFSLLIVAGLLYFWRNVYQKYHPSFCCPFETASEASEHGKL